MDNRRGLGVKGPGPATAWFALMELIRSSVLVPTYDTSSIRSDINSRWMPKLHWKDLASFICISNVVRLLSSRAGTSKLGETGRGMPSLIVNGHGAPSFSATQFY